MNELIEKRQALAGEQEKLPEKTGKKTNAEKVTYLTLVKSERNHQYDCPAPITNFTNNMLTQDFVHFRISGMAIYSTAKLHYKKIRM